jgi:hypothetical protein
MQLQFGIIHDVASTAADSQQLGQLRLLLPVLATAILLVHDSAAVAHHLAMMVAPRCKRAPDHEAS